MYHRSALICIVLLFMGPSSLLSWTSWCSAWLVCIMSWSLSLPELFLSQAFRVPTKLAPELTGWLGSFRPLISNKIQSEQREVCHVWPVWILQLSLDNVQDECGWNQIELVRPYLKRVINKFMHRFAWLSAWYEKHCNSCYFFEGWWWGFAKSTRWSSTHRNRDSRIYCWEVKMLMNLLN